MAGGAFSLGDVFVNFVANVDGLIAGLNEVKVASAEVAGVATKDLEEVGAAGVGAGASVEASGIAARDSAGMFNAFGDSLIKTLAPMLAIFGAYEGVKDILSSANTATNEWNNAIVQVNNTLSQQGVQVHMTSQQIQKLAEETSKSTPITKGAQLQGEAILLTYKSVGPVFENVAKILPDVATAFANVQGRSVASSEDVAQAAKKLGVALTDPEVGVNALTRAGIKFTAAQQDEIKALQASGDVLGAQRLLLSDFADMTAGKATTSLKTYQGAVANAKKQFDDYVGNGIRVAQKALESLGTVLQKVGVFLVQHKPLLIAVTGALGALALVIGGALVFAIGSAIVGFISLDAAALPWIAAALAIGAGIALIIYYWKSWHNEIELFLVIIAPFIGLPVVIATHWNLVKQWFDDFWHWIKAIFSDIVNAIVGYFKWQVDTILNYWQKVYNWFKDLPGNIVKWIGDVSRLLYDIGKNIIQGLINGLESMVGTVENKIKAIANGIKDVAKKILGIFSPSTVFHEIGQNIGQGMANGINSMTDVVSNAAAGMANATLVGSNGSFSGSVSGGGYGSGFTVSLDGAQIIGAVPQDVAEKIGDAIVGKLKRTVRI